MSVAWGDVIAQNVARNSEIPLSGVVAVLTDVAARLPRDIRTGRIGLTKLMEAAGIEPAYHSDRSSCCDPGSMLAARRSG